jgi:hypothetical protein
MVSVAGIFKVQSIKDINGTQLLKLSNSDKNLDNTYNNTYYSLWLNAKALGLIEPTLIEELDTKPMIWVEGWLKVTKSGQYTTLTIYPTRCNKYDKEPK